MASLLGPLKWAPPEVPVRVLGFRHELHLGGKHRESGVLRKKGSAEWAMGATLGFQVRLRISAHEVGGGRQAVDSMEKDGMSGVQRG